MKTIMMTAAAVAFSAGAVMAQPVQTGVVGNSGNAAYPLQVTASNGETYFCEEEIQTINGVASRACIQPGGGGLGGLGGGIAPGVGIGVGVIAIALIADSSSSTTTP